VGRCREAIERHQVDNVGGVMITVPRTGGLMGRAIVWSLSHRFGVGGSHFRTGSSERRIVDTVFGGFYRREVFERVGEFNERLSRGQDIEFNLRLKRAGGQTLLDPEIVSTYVARSEYGPFLRHNFSNGEWVVLAFTRSEIRPVTLRHLVPMAFVLSLLAGCGLAWATGIVWPVLSVAGAYLLAASAVAASIAIRAREARLFPALVAAFGGLHLSYGLGSLRGAGRICAERIRQWFRTR
jgi:hypothetical protein